jgi:probable HAF family extracellular repeat protein
MRIAGRTSHPVPVVHGRVSLRRASVATTLLLALFVACRGELPTNPSDAGLRPTTPDLTLGGGTGTQIFPTNPGAQPVGVAIGLNDAGQVTGSEFGLVTSDDDFKPYRWSTATGAVKLVGCCDSEWGNDINDAGTVVGVAQTNALLGNRGWVATGTSLTALPILSGGDVESSSGAIAINNSGQIVGVSPAPSFTNHAVLWSSAGAIQDLGTLGGSNSTAIDINDAGQVIGSSQTIGNAATHFFLWSSGSGMQDLNTLIDPNVTSVVEINATGQIIGTYLTGGQSHAFLYTPGSGLRDLGTLGGTTSAPTGLNDNGDVVGRSSLADASVHAFLWTATDGMEDITAVTGVPEVRRLNDNLQTLTGTAAPSTNPTFGRLRPQLVQLTKTQSNTPPVATFTANCVGQNYPTQCAFDASGSTDDAGIVSYAWDWGNGRSETKTVPTVRNTWSAPGVYTVTLKVTDAGGLSGYYSAQVTVGTLPPNQPPTVQIKPGYPDDGMSFPEGVLLPFAAIATDPEDGIIPSPNYSWSSSIDGFLGTGATITAPLLSVGTHTITVTATDSQGATGTKSFSITITPKPANQPPVASFTWNCTGLNLHQCAFDATSSTDDNGIVSFKWDWGNGRSETKGIYTVRNTWASAGTYTVTLTVTDTGGLTASTSQQVVVP